MVGRQPRAPPSACPSVSCPCVRTPAARAAQGAGGTGSRACARSPGGTGSSAWGAAAATVQAANRSVSRGWAVPCPSAGVRRPWRAALGCACQAEPARERGSMVSAPSRGEGLGISPVAGKAHMAGIKPGGQPAGAKLPPAWGEPLLPGGPPAPGRLWQSLLPPPGDTLGTGMPGARTPIPVTFSLLFKCLVRLCHSMFLIISLPSY